MKWWLVFTCLPAMAQLTVSTVSPSGVESKVDGLVNAGSANPGDFLDTRFRLRNSGTQSLGLNSLRINGTGFSLQGTPSLPYLMAPGTNVDFRVRFQPDAFGTYSATLQVNEITVVVRGITPPSATLSWETSPGKYQTVNNGAPLDFGRVELGSFVSRRFVVANESPVTVQISNLVVGGESFVLEEGTVLPSDLSSGAQAGFTVRLAPRRPGIPQGTLTINTRTIQLTGSVPDPPLPDAQMQISSSTVRSGQQIKLSVKLASAAPFASTGKLTLSFRASDSSTGDDPAIQFVPSGLRSVDLTASVGDSALKPDLVFQSGTTAGTITFVLEFGPQRKQVSVAIDKDTVRLDQIKLLRGVNTVEVWATGFDNTRTASETAFTFYDLSGNLLQPGPLRIDSTGAFGTYYSRSSLGGVFQMKASFPVTGDVTQIGAVQVELKNSIGVAKSDRISN